MTTVVIGIPLVIAELRKMTTVMISTIHCHCDNTNDVNNCDMFQAWMLRLGQLHDPVQPLRAHILLKAGLPLP